MVKTGIIRRKTKSTITLVAFEWGMRNRPTTPSTSLYYCDIEEAITIEGKTYQPNPKMALDLPKFSGTLAEEKLSLTLPFVANSFEDYISDGFPHAPVRVVVRELLIARSSRLALDDTDAPTVLYLFTGMVSTAIRNPAGYAGQVKLEALGPKSLLKNIKGGLLVSAQCTNLFGGQGCGKDLSVQTDPTHGKLSLFDDVELTSFDGTSAVLTQVSVGTDLTGKVADYWNDGYWEYLGLRLKIRQWEGSNNFVLLNQPRASLIGAVGTLVPGCSRFLTRCQFWGNEGNFMGTGIAIPAYNPLYEVP